MATSSLFIRRVQRNKKFKRLIEMRKKGLFAVDHEKAIKEIRQLHTTRIMRTLTPKTVMQNFQHKATEISLQNSAFRSRIAELKMDFFKLRAQLVKHIKAMRNYLSSRYSSELRREFTTLDARKKVLDYMMKDFDDIADDFQLVVDIADIVIEDIDKAYWSIRAVIDVMEIASKDR